MGLTLYSVSLILLTVVRVHVMVKRQVRFQWNDFDDATNTFFDRLVVISYSFTHNKRQTDMPQTTGVLITKNLILTSNNAFISASKQKTIRRIMISIVTGRFLTNSGKRLFYDMYNEGGNSLFPIECARQVIPVFLKESVPSDMRHGSHHPVHDLMVMRVSKDIEFVDRIPEPANSFKQYITSENYNKTLHLYFAKSGPIKTLLAKPDDELGPDIKFASMGHKNNRHISIPGRLYAAESTKEALVDCDEWVPRHWGLFICLLNTEKFVGIASGGMLFSGDKLFGVGSFALFRDKQSILIFTDVRPYRSLLLNTCTKLDQKLQMNNQSIDQSTSSDLFFN